MFGHAGKFKNIIIPPELRYVEVIALAANSGCDANLEDGRDEEEKELPSTVTFLVKLEQAMILAELEAKGTIHLTNQISLIGDKVNLIMEGVNRYLMELAKEQIRIAFEQAEKEVAASSSENQGRD